MMSLLDLLPPYKIVKWPIILFLAVSVLTLITMEAPAQRGSLTKGHRVITVTEGAAYRIEKASGTTFIDWIDEATDEFITSHPHLEVTGGAMINRCDQRPSLLIFTREKSPLSSRPAGSVTNN